MSGSPSTRHGSPTKPRLLVVPHLFTEDFAVREIELARRLTSRFEVFLLQWRDALLVDSSSVSARRLRQILTASSSAVRLRTRVQQREGITLIASPVWQPILFQKVIGPQKALSFCQWHNHRKLRRMVSALRITHLLLANNLFHVQPIPGVRTFYDVVDWFPEETLCATELQAVYSKLRAISRRVDAIFAVSEVLSEKLERDSGVKAVPLPNGADLSRFRNVDPARVRALRQKLGIADKFVIGYIGNHGTFSGVDLVVNAFLDARASLPDAVLLIVGPAETWRELLDSKSNSGVIATGKVPPSEMPEYFHALDLGVLAQGRTTGTDFAFQIKVVEYSACRKCVVSTPLLNWQRLAWPNVVLAEPNVGAWAEAFVNARALRWQPQWDRLLEAYDWRVLADKVADIMLSQSLCGS